MADIQDTTVPYEILIRFSETGNLQGAHYITRRIVTMGDVILKNEPSEAQPINLETGLESVLGAALVSALATIDIQTARIAELETSSTPATNESV